MEQKGHGQGITSDPGALCVWQPNRYGPATRRALSTGRFARTPMAQKVRIALDAMGGDIGPAVVVPGADLSLARHPDTEFILYGDQAVVTPLVEQRPRLKAASRIVHTDVVVRMDAKPSQ